MADEGNSSPIPGTSTQINVSDGDDSGNMFEAVGVEVSMDDWVKWHEAGGMVEIHYEDQETGDNIEIPLTANLDLLSSLSVSDAKPLPVTETNQAEESVIVQPEHMSTLETLPSNELVMQYLKGDMSFTEFSELLDIAEMQNAKGQTEGQSEEELEEEEEEEVGREEVQGNESVQEEEEDILKYKDNKDDPDYIPRKSKRSTKKSKASSQSDVSGTESPGKQKKKKRVFTRKQIPKALQGLMGEANLRFARGDNQGAIDMCLEIIKEAPRAVYPYQTLAIIYESMGDEKKTLEFTSLAACLSPRDEDQWQRLAEMYLEQNNTHGAIDAYTRALKYNPKNYQFHIERAKLNEEIGEGKKAMDGYKVALNYMPKDLANEYMDMARSLSEFYYKASDRQTAILLMRNAFIEHPEKVTSEDVNLVLELQMSESWYFESIEVLIHHCGVSFIFQDNQVWDKYSRFTIKEEQLVNREITIETCLIPELLPVDLRVKLAICLIHHGQICLVNPVIGLLLDENVDEMGDLFLDIAEAYMEENYFKQARPILLNLVSSAKFNLAAVWLKLAECHDKLNELDYAVSAYDKVVSLAPLHVGARMALSTIQQKLGRHDEAVLALSHDDGGSESLLTKQEQVLLQQKCFLLYTHKRYDEFIIACRQLLFNQFKDINSHTLLNVIFTYKNARHKIEDIMPHMKPGAYQGVGKSEIPVDDLWDLFVKLCDLLYDLGRMDDLLETTGLGMACPYFMADPRKQKQAEFLCMATCILTKHGSLAFSFVREMCLKNGNNNQVWNILSQIMVIAVENRHNRFCMRYLLSHPENVPVCILNGHSAALSGTYLYALGEYVAALRNWPEDPLIHLCIGLTFVHLAGQKFSARKHFLLTQGLAFLNSYSELRGECQEAYFNIGRALHQLGLAYAAVYYYKKVLEMRPAIDHPDGIFDMTREAAYNLCLIYRSSGSTESAHLLVSRYLVI